MTAQGGKYGGRKVREGTVVSDKMQKTVIVAVESHFRHPLYKKSVRRVRRFMAHDEAETAQLGDRVRIVESRPMSRRKRWRVVEVLAKAEMPELAAEAIDLELLGEVKPEEEPIGAPEPAAAAPDPAPADEPGQEPAAEAAAPPVEAQEEAPAGGVGGESGDAAQGETAPPLGEGAADEAVTAGDGGQEVEA